MAQTLRNRNRNTSRSTSRSRSTERRRGGGRQAGSVRRAGGANTKVNWKKTWKWVNKNKAKTAAAAAILIAGGDHATGANGRKGLMKLFNSFMSGENGAKVTPIIGEYNGGDKTDS
jgi:hypothetical protein